MGAEEYIDSEGRRWISPARVAELWNERAHADGHESNYTRFSVRQRRSGLTAMQTPLGYLYLEESARTISLRARSTKRPDVTQRNKEKGKKQQEESPKTLDEAA